VSGAVQRRHSETTASCRALRSRRPLARRARTFDRGDHTRPKPLDDPAPTSKPSFSAPASEPGAHPCRSSCPRYDAAAPPPTRTYDSSRQWFDSRCARMSPCLHCARLSTSRRAPPPLAPDCRGRSTASALGRPVALAALRSWAISPPRCARAPEPFLRLEPLNACFPVGPSTAPSVVSGRHEAYHWTAEEGGTPQRIFGHARPPRPTRHHWCGPAMNIVSPVEESHP